HLSIGTLLRLNGKPEEALTAWRRALAIQQQLADANPAVAEFQHARARSHFNIGIVLRDTGKLGETLKEHQKALAIQQKLADANPAVAGSQRDPAISNSIID